MLRAMRPGHASRAAADHAVGSTVQVGGQYAEMFRLDDPIGGEHMNIFKAGLLTAHRVVAVSHGCAAAG